MSKVAITNKWKWIAIATVSCSGGFYLFANDQLQGILFVIFGFAVLVFGLGAFQIDLRQMREDYSRHFKPEIKWLQYFLPSLAVVSLIALDVCHTGYVRLEWLSLPILAMVAFIGWASSYLFSTIIHFFELCLGLPIIAQDPIRLTNISPIDLPTQPSVIFSPPRFRLAHREA